MQPLSIAHTWSTPSRYAALRAHTPHPRLSFPPRSWESFLEDYQPIRRVRGSLLWPAADIPARMADGHVWSLIPHHGTRTIIAGRHHRDAIGFLLTAARWAGLPGLVPVYACPEVLP